MMQSASEKQHGRWLYRSFRDCSHGICQINQGHQLKESFLESFLKGKIQLREKTSRSFLSRRFSVFPPARQRQTNPAAKLSLPLKGRIQNMDRAHVVHSPLLRAAILTSERGQASSRPIRRSAAQSRW